MSKSEAWRTSTTVAEYREKVRTLATDLAFIKGGPADEHQRNVADQLHLLGNMALEDADTINRRILVEQVKEANANGSESETL